MFDSANTNSAKPSVFVWVVCSGGFWAIVRDAFFTGLANYRAAMLGVGVNQKNATTGELW